MAEDTSEEHAHSKKRKLENAADDGGRKKHKKHKTRTVEQQESESAPVAETPSALAADTDTVADSVESSPKKHKKKSKKYKETLVDDPSHESVEMALETQDGGGAAESIEPQPEKAKEKRKKDKTERKRKRKEMEMEKEDSGVVDMQDKAPEPTPIVNEANVEAPIESHREKKKKKKDKNKDRDEEKNRVDEDEAGVVLQDGALEPSFSSYNGTSIAEPLDSPTEKKKKKKDKSKSKDKDKGAEEEKTIDSQAQVSKSTISLQNLEASNSDDILQAFQQLDLARLQGVLGTLNLESFNFDSTQDEDSQPTAIGNSQSQSTTAQPKKATTKSSGRRPVSDDIPKPSTKNKRKPVVDLSNLVDPNAGDPQSTLLATKWLSSKELQNLADTQGLIFKKGRFSNTEHQAVKTAMEQYRTRSGKTEEEMTQFLFSNVRREQEHIQFWAEITRAVPGRPVQAVYHHVKRSYDPRSHQGKWIPAEDAALRRAVADLGSAWSKISQRIGRTGQDCKDRWKNHLSLPDKQFGKWSQEEIDELTSVVESFTVNKGKDPDGNIFWGAVSLKMGGRRSREQCREKWESLRLQMDNETDSVRRWSNNDTYVLLQRMADLTVNDDSEVVWKELVYDQLNLWTPYRLQRAYRHAEKTIPDYENMAFKDILSLLLDRYKKYAVPKAKKKKFPQAPEPKSAEMVEDDSANEQSADDDG